MDSVVGIQRMTGLETNELHVGKFVRIFNALVRSSSLEKTITFGGFSTLFLLNYYSKVPLL